MTIRPGLEPASNATAANEPSIAGASGRPGPRTFRRREAAFGRLGIAAVPVAVLIMMVPAVVALGSGAGFAGVIPLVFWAFGVLQLLPVPRRWRIYSGPPELLVIDGERIKVSRLCNLPWADIDEIRLTRLPTPAWAGPPSWAQLEIVPRDRALLLQRPWWDRAFDAYRRMIGVLVRRPSYQEAGAFHFELDLLEAPWRDVVVAIEEHRPVRRI